MALRLYRSTKHQSLRTLRVTPGEFVEIDPDDPAWQPWLEGDHPSLIPADDETAKPQRATVAMTADGHTFLVDYDGPDELFKAAAVVSYPDYSTDGDSAAIRPT